MITKETLAAAVTHLRQHADRQFADGSHWVARANTRLQEGGYTLAVGRELRAAGLIVNDGDGTSIPLPVPNADTAPVPVTPPATTPPTPVIGKRAAAILFLIDANNVARTCEDLGLAFRPERYWCAAREYGTIAFPFAIGNYFAMSPPQRLRITKAGLQTIHVDTIPTREGPGKDVVDEHLVDLATRFREFASIDLLIIATDDQHFIPVINAFHDRGVRVVRFGLRPVGALDRMCDVRLLNEMLRAEDARESTVPPPATPDHGSWASDEFIRRLAALSSITDSETQDREIADLERMASTATTILSWVIRQWWRQLPRDRGIKFYELVTFAERTCRMIPADQSPNRTQLCTFLTTMVRLRIMEQQESPHGTRGGISHKRYLPSWNHPFCRHAIADIHSAPFASRPIPDSTHRSNGKSATRPPNGTRFPAMTPHSDRVWYVVNEQNDDVLAIAAARVEDALGDAKRYYDDREDIAELFERERAALFGTLRVVEHPPAGKTSIGIDDAAANPPPGRQPFFVTNDYDDKVWSLAAENGQTAVAAVTHHYRHLPEVQQLSDEGRHMIFRTFRTIPEPPDGITTFPLPQ